MKFCMKHWNECREAVEAHGLSGLVSKSGEELAKIISNGSETPQNFDPLFSMNNHFFGIAIKVGGLYMLEVDPTNEALKANEGHRCPACEPETHAPGYVFKNEAMKVAKQMADWCRENKMIPAVN